MKQFPILLMSAILANSAFGQTLIIEQTNIVSVCYEDTSISGEMLTQVSNEVVRMFVPTLPLIEITRSEGTLRHPHWINRCWLPDTTDHGIKMSNALTGTGTNLTLTIPKSFTDSFAESVEFCAAHAVELAKLDEFASLLVTNPISRMSVPQVKALFLTKEFAPYSISDNDALQAKEEYGRATFFRVPRQTVRYESIGPTGSARYLWASIPCLDSADVPSYERNVMYFPLIYYRDRWWLCTWPFEPGEQEWQ